MSDVSLGGSKPKTMKADEQTKQKMIYLNIPTALMMIIELGDSKNIKKYADPIIQSIKQSSNNKELRKLVCQMFGVPTAKKFKKFKPKEFEIMTTLIGDIWGLKK